MIGGFTVDFGFHTLVLFGTFVLGVLVVGVAASRGPMAAFAVILVATSWWAIRTGRRARVVVGWTLVTASVVFGGRVIQNQLGFNPIGRLQSAFTLLDDRAISFRATYARDAWQQFIDHPVLGSSLDERVSGYYPHNVIIESFMATGILGGMAFVMLVVLSLVATALTIHRGHAGSWVGLLYLQYLVGAQFSGALYLSNTMWAFMAAVVTMAAGIKGVGPTGLLALRASGLGSQAPVTDHG